MRSNSNPQPVGDAPQHVPSTVPSLTSPVSHQHDTSVLHVPQPRTSDASAVSVAAPAVVVVASSPVRTAQPQQSTSIAELQAELALERKQHQQTKITLQAYAAELSDLLERQQEQQEHTAVYSSREADQALLQQSASEVASLKGDVALLEAAFSQMKQQFDAGQEQIKALTLSEERLQVELLDAVEQLTQTNTKYRLLRIQAQAKLSAASEQIDHVTRVSEDEIALLKAKLIKSEAALSAKNAELRTLQSLCDELLGKLEGHSGRASESSDRHLDTWLLDDDSNGGPVE
jgi:chromosome segregation ATPase